jgi:hypothetical protein
VRLLRSILLAAQTFVRVWALQTQVISPLRHVQEMLGEVLALSSPADSLAAFKRALDLQRAAVAANGHADSSPVDGVATGGARNGSAAHDAGPKPRLLNNAAVMTYRGGKSEDARDLIIEAIERLRNSTLSLFLCWAEPQL